MAKRPRRYYPLALGRGEILSTLLLEEAQVTRTLLIDADLLAYMASAGSQRSYYFDGPDAPPAVSADFDEAREAIEEKIGGLIDRLQPDEVTICLSDDIDSFRKDLVDPTYKATRTSERPKQLYPLKDWLRDQYVVEERPLLEADDVMGIIATDPSRTDERIIVSADKDMLTIPGRLYQPHRQVDAQGRPLKKPLILDVTPEAAARYHLYQTLIGDQTDGYPGLPMCGPKCANEILDGVMWVEKERTLKSGPRKGLSITEWVRSEGDYVPAWLRIVAAYRKGGLAEADALKQARLARILHHRDYADGRVILWKPEIIT